MVTFYAAVGQISNFWHNSRIPQVERHKEICELDPPEFIIWSSVIWNIYEYEELKKVFARRCEEIGIVPDFEFDYYLQRLEFRKLVKSGRGCTGITALYALLLDLYICPINCGFIENVIVFFRLLVRKIPFSVAKHVFDKEDFETKEEHSVWQIANQSFLSVAEVITCVIKGIKKIDEDDIVEKIYGEEQDNNTIGAYAQINDDEHKVITAIAELYLKKKIIFEV